MTLEKMIFDLIDENYRLKVENYELKKEIEEMKKEAKDVQNTKSRRN